jgi:glycosidase
MVPANLSKMIRHKASVINMMIRLLCLCLPLLAAVASVEAAPASRPVLSKGKAASRPVVGRVAVPWWRDAVMYQIFVRSFQDSNGDGVGDLQGIIQRLDALRALPGASGKKALGVTGLWLTPVFRSPSYHGYDATDYRAIQPAYGTLSVFKKLIREAHKRGMRVILDLMVNHTSRKHPWFRRAVKARTPAHRNWYVWRDRDPGWRQPWGQGRVWHSIGESYYYGLFWGGMPDLNFRHPPVRKAIHGIVRHWLKLGVDGFRLDAARYIFANGPGAKQYEQPETFAFWRTFRTHAKRTSKSALLVGEIWAKSKQIQPYCQGDMFDLAFHFPLANAIRLSVSAMEAAPLWKVLSRSYSRGCWATFLSNHDQRRIFSQLAQNKPMMRNAAFLLLTLPGTPFLYYGEEIGMINGPQRGDLAKRTPMRWGQTRFAGFSPRRPWTALSNMKTSVAAQRRDRGSLWHWYRRLIALRHRVVALRRGSMKRLWLKGKGKDGVVAFVRKGQQKTVWVLVNTSDEATGLLQVQKQSEVKEAKILFHEGFYQTTVGRGVALKLGAYSKLVIEISR